MTPEDRVKFVVKWIKNYCDSLDKFPVALVVGVSGGIDSAVASTLSAKTGLRTIAISMPIKQNHEQYNLSLKHLEWLTVKFNNVSTEVVVLDNVFNSFQVIMKGFDSEIAFANSRSRLRMVTLYQIAQSKNGLVVGTGNKIEDFGVGFYTKYGDGGVDISPIADCTKTDVWELGKELKVLEQIINAKPTDGLWDDERTDESQLGLKYKEVEEAMSNPNSPNYEKYIKIRKLNLHKMEPIPVCKIPK